MKKSMIIRDFIKSTFLLLIVLFIWFVFEDKLMQIFDTKILPLLEDMKFSNTSTTLFILIALLTIYGIYKCMRHKYYIQYRTFLFLSFIVFIYIRNRIFGVYISTPPVIFNWGYTDIGIILLVLFLISCLFSYFYSPKKGKDGSCVFIQDKPILDPESDLLDYSESAKDLAKDLEEMQVETSCSIGLISPWGTGKTSYLNLLEYHLNKKKFIIVKFNPRYSRNTKNIQEAFFNELFSKLGDYDLGFSSTFKQYLRAIDVANENKIISFIYQINKIWSKEDEKDKINNAILRLNKRIVVIIEDFDRLLCDEIIEVFKLIDGNASFSNLIFITAYDKRHINKIIGKTYSNEDTLFSDKFFNIEIQIPLRPYDKIYRYIESNLLKGLNIAVKDEELYKSILSSHLELLKKYIITLRDAKRFLNLFIRQYMQVKEEVVFSDYILLYLIKYKYLDDYLKLYKKEVISSDIIKPDYELLKSDSKIKSNDILEILFSESPCSELRSIKRKTAFGIYFHENVYGHLKMEDMKKVFEKDEDYRSLIQKFEQKGAIQDISSFLGSKNILILGTKERFERYIDIWFYLLVKFGEKTPALSSLLSLINSANSKEIQKNYRYDEDEYKGLISTKLQGKYKEYPFTIVAHILMRIIMNEFKEEIIFSKEDVFNIAYKSLENLIENNKQLEKIHLDLLCSCISDINQATKIITLDDDACNKVLALIIQNPAGYFSNFVRLGMPPFYEDFNSVACEPFWNQIFKDTNSFKQFIEKQDERSVPNIILIKNFWKLYENNNYKPIEFQNKGKVQTKIDNNLINEVKELDKLLEIEQEFNEYEAKKNKTQSAESDNLDYYKKLLDKIDDLELYIYKTGDIRSKIESAVSSIS